MDSGSNGVRADLTEDVNLNARVDGGNFGILGNVELVIDVINAHHDNVGVVVDKLVQLAGANQERASHSTRLQLLETISDDTCCKGSCLGLISRN